MKLHRLALVLLLAPLCACGAQLPTAKPSDLPFCSFQGTASGDWPLPQPPPSSTPPIVSATVSGDTLRFTFTSGTPPYQAFSQSGTDFTEDPSGKPVTLAGTDGVRIVMTGFRGDQSNYKGEKKLKSTGPRLLEVAGLGDSEGTVSWGVGLSSPSCADISTSGSTLTFLFIPQT
jgi:hypothetical protein